MSDEAKTIKIKKETVERAIELARWFHKTHHMIRDVTIIPDIEALLTSNQNTEIDIDLKTLRYLQDRATKTHEIQKTAIAREVIAELEAAAKNNSYDNNPGSLLR